MDGCRMSLSRHFVTAIGAGRRQFRSGRRLPRAARLFRRAECGLCDEALALLRPHIRSGRLMVEEVDIESDPGLLRRYFLAIPVLAIEDGPTLSWPFDHQDLRRALA
jgi:hypothetical protein